jgi:hypothetical protein
MLEYRVVVDKAGLKSCDYYFDPDRAKDRKKKLLREYTVQQVSVQSREVTEWKDVD